MESSRYDMIRQHAEDLVAIFLENLEGEAFVDTSSDEENVIVNVTKNGMMQLTSKFDEVPVLDRIAVYSTFLDELTAAGVPYDQDQFEQVPGSVH